MQRLEQTDSVRGWTSAEENSARFTRKDLEENGADPTTTAGNTENCTEELETDGQLSLSLVVKGQGADSTEPVSLVVKGQGGEIQKPLSLAVKGQGADSLDPLSQVVKKQEAALKRLEAIHGPGYGKPVPGSKTEVRAQKYQASCVREIVELCGVVSERGYTDTIGRRAILFGDLFNSYRFISDKCCGLLLRARKYKLLEFEGEMLFQGKDDNTVITMLRTFSEIHGHFVQTKQIIQPGETFVAVPLKVKVRKKVAKKLSRNSSFRRKEKAKLVAEKEATID